MNLECSILNCYSWKVPYLASSGNEKVITALMDPSEGIYWLMYNKMHHLSSEWTQILSKSILKHKIISWVQFYYTKLCYHLRIMWFSAQTLIPFIEELKGCPRSAHIWAFSLNNSSVLVLIICWITRLVHIQNLSKHFNCKKAWKWLGQKFQKPKPSIKFNCQFSQELIDFWTIKTIDVK